MKNIELTENHKSKLLEMCKKLFPETYSKTWDIEGLFDYEPIDDENFECVHWFEFCMTHLIQKIDNFHSEKILKPLEDKACKEGYPDNWLEIWNERPWIKLWSLTNSGNYKKHPINYLYEEFKKLK